MFCRRGAAMSGRLLRQPDNCSPNRHQRLSRHAARYKRDRRTSTSALDKPMSASRWSLSSRSCLYSYRRSNHSAIPVSQASGISQDHPRFGNEDDVASKAVAELQVVLPQDMFLLHNGVKQRFAAGAHRAVVNSPSDFRTIPTSGAQAIVSRHQLMKSPCGLPRFTISRQYA